MGVSVVRVNNNKLSGEFISHRCETKNGIFGRTKTFFVMGLRIITYAAFVRAVISRDKVYDFP